MMIMRRYCQIVKPIFEINKEKLLCSHLGFSFSPRFLKSSILCLSGVFSGISLAPSVIVPSQRLVPRNKHLDIEITIKMDSISHKIQKQSLTNSC